MYFVYDIKSVQTKIILIGLNIYLQWGGWSLNLSTLNIFEKIK